MRIVAHAPTDGVPDVHQFKDLDDAAEAMAKIRNTANAIGEDLVRAEVSRVFEEVPEIEGITWTQYTPYFMDGDPCVFGINEIHVLNDMVKEDIAAEVGDDVENMSIEQLADHYWDWEETHTYGLDHWEKNPDTPNGYPQIPVYRPGTEDARERLKLFADRIYGNQEIMLEAFGDHAQIIASRDGISVNEYHHD